MRLFSASRARAITGSLGLVALFAALWVILVDGDARSPLVAGLSIAGAAAASRALRSPVRMRWSLPGALRFMIFFVRSSVVGSVDVAMRALRPALPLAPALITYDMRLRRRTPAAIFFLDVINMLPGTLCAEIQGPSILIHVIDHQRANEQEVSQLEAHVAAMFREGVEPDPERSPRA